MTNWFIGDEFTERLSKLSSVSPSDMEEIHKQYSEGRHGSTGLWLQTDTRYQRWKDPKAPMGEETSRDKLDELFETERYRQDQELRGPLHNASKIYSYTLWCPGQRKSAALLFAHDELMPSSWCRENLPCVSTIAFFVPVYILTCSKLLDHRRYP